MLSISETILLGILYTDGCLSPKGKNGWRFYLGSTSWEIIQTFKRCLMQVLNLPEKRIRISQKLVNNKPFYKAVADDAAAGKLLTNKYGTFRTLKYSSGIFPSTKLPEELFKDFKIASQFLKIAFSCDGGINLYVARNKYTWLIRNVYLSCHHPTLIQQYYLLLRKVGVEAKILLKDNLIRIQGKENLKSFLQKVGFMEGVKITQSSAYWQGFEKQKLLRLAIASYGNPRKIINLSQFKVKI